MINKIFITDSYSLNSGDIAILLVTVESIKKIKFNAEISIEVSHPNFTKKISDFKNVNIFPRIFDIQNIDNTSNLLIKIKSIFIGFYDSLSFLAWAIFKRFCISTDFIIRKSRREQAKKFSDANIVISTGGGFLSNYYNYGFRLYIYLIGFILRKRIILFAQSISPFNTIFSKALIPFFLNKCDYILIREPFSYNYLKKFNLSTEPILTADLALLLPPHSDKKILKVFNGQRKVISICIRSYANKKEEQRYKNCLKKVVKYLIQKGFYILIISQMIKDNECGKEIAEISSKNIKFLKFGCNPKVLKEIYRKSKFVIASRMHAIIFAIGSETPFISLSYEPKFSGLMQQLDYNKSLQLNYTNINKDKIIYLIEYLLKKYDKISDSLKDNVPELVNKSLLNIKILKQIMDEKIE